MIWYKTTINNDNLMKGIYDSQIKNVRYHTLNNWLISEV